MSARRKSLLPTGAYIKKLIKMVMIVSSMILPELLKDVELTLVVELSLVSDVIVRILVSLLDYASSLNKYLDKFILIAC